MNTRLWNRARRRALGISQGKLGKKIGTWATMVCQYEKGSPSFERYEKDITMALDEIQNAYCEDSPYENKMLMLKTWVLYRDELCRNKMLDEKEEKAILAGIRRWANDV